MALPSSQLLKPSEFHLSRPLIQPASAELRLNPTPHRQGKQQAHGWIHVSCLGSAALLHSQMQLQPTCPSFWRIIPSSQLSSSFPSTYLRQPTLPLVPLSSTPGSLNQPRCHFNKFLPRFQAQSICWLCTIQGLDKQHSSATCTHKIPRDERYTDPSANRNCPCSFLKS